MKKINFLYHFLLLILGLLTTVVYSSNSTSVSDIFRHISKLNHLLPKTNDFQVWSNESIKWMDKMQINTVGFDNLLVYSWGCKRDICSCPNQYATISFSDNSFEFISNWSKSKKHDFSFRRFYMPGLNLGTHLRFDFKTEAFTFSKRLIPWMLYVRQGEFRFINSLYRGCSFSFEIFFPAEYLESKRKELSNMISSFYQDNQAKFAQEHMERLKKDKVKKGKNTK